ncbi:hypothetical protein V2J09_000752 [Rumex salicifolius]
MVYVFGSTFVCKTREAAVKVCPPLVAFNQDRGIDVREPCVTLEGDVFQPSGLLTGGSRSAFKNSQGQNHYQKIK